MIQRFREASQDFLYKKNSLKTGKMKIFPVNFFSIDGFQWEGSRRSASPDAGD
jgi:hypothetical protein